MSRERFIHPELLESEDYHSLSFAAQSLFVGLIVLADDYGRGKASRRSLLGSIFPGRLTIGKLEALIDELRTRRMALFYSSGESPYYFLPAWEEYQHPKYRKLSKIPEYQPELESGTNPGQIVPGSGTSRATGWEGLGREGLGREGAAKAKAARCSLITPNGELGFPEWWEVMRAWFKLADRNLGYKKQALELWKKTKRADVKDEMILRLTKQKNHYHDTLRSNGSPVPPQDPHRYLRNERYNDVLP